MAREGHGPIEAYGGNRRQPQISRPGSHPGRMVRIAFVCVENAGRSQMAAGFARAIADRGEEVLSGGTLPAKDVNPVVVDVMREAGVDLSRERPHRIKPSELEGCDVVVTMGCAAGDICPATFRGDAVDWALPDPKGRSKAEVREIRDEIERRVRALFAEIREGAEPEA